MSLEGMLVFAGLALCLVIGVGFVGLQSAVGAVWRNRSICGVLFVVLIGPTSPASAEAYPTRPIQMVVAWPAGGATDTVARKLADELSKRLGHPIIIQNRPGATGVIGTETVARANPDGYTLFFASSEHALNQAFFKKLPYDGIHDFIPIAGVAMQPFVLIAGSNTKFSTLQDLIAMANAAPGKYTFASWGRGSLPHLGMELLKEKSGVDLLHVPFKGAAPALQDVVGGFVDILFISLTTVAPHFKDGKVKVLALSAAKRFSAYPDVPTFTQLGYPNVSVSQWFGVLAPKGTPQPIADKLSKEIAEIMQSGDMAKWSTSMDLVPMPMNSAKFGEFVQSESARWTNVMRENKIVSE